MDYVTAEQVKRAVAEHFVTRWNLHRCSICSYPVNYRFREGAVYFDPGCYCVSYQAPLEQRSYEEVARTLNMQRPDVRASMYAELIGVPKRQEQGK